MTARIAANECIARDHLRHDLAALHDIADERREHWVSGSWLRTCAR
jgi:hypothetical protein